jgi:hypothetical protein
MGEMIDKPTMYSKNIAGVSQYINTSLNCDSCFDLKRVEVENKGVTPKYGDKSMVWESEYEVLLTHQQIQIAQNFLKKYFGEEALHLENITPKQIIQAVDKLRLTPEIKMFWFPDDFILIFDCEENIFEREIQEMFDKLVDVQMPPFLVEFYSNRLFLTEEMGMAVFIEYIKFLILKSRDSNVVPSFLVDLFWREHFTNTVHYRWLCENVFGLNSPILYEQHSSSEFKERYEITLKTYEDTFKSDAIPFIWKSYGEEIELKRTKFYEANLYRLALYEFYEKEMGNFD